LTRDRQEDYKSPREKKGVTEGKIRPKSKIAPLNLQARNRFFKGRERGKYPHERRGGGKKKELALRELQRMYFSNVTHEELRLLGRHFRGGNALR